LVDIGTGVLTAFGIALAIYHRVRTGRGQHVQTSLAQTATYHQTIYMLDYPGAVHDEPRGWEALGTSPLQRFYQASDGWFFLGAGDVDCGQVAQVAGLAAFDASSQEDIRALEARLAERTVIEWVDCLRQAGLSAQAVVELPDLMVDPWVREHGLSISQTSTEVGDVTYPGTSVRLTRTPMRVGAAASRPGGDAQAVLSEVGLGQDAISSLERAWALQTTNPPPGW
jgi:crotonobetainyl-CoA:carnitine CoA-transferase CaiB-like acyl-CoA transferase